jgi:signal transduction histidine kinase/FixJ family two-component response regulator
MTTHNPIKEKSVPAKDNNRSPELNDLLMRLTGNLIQCEVKEMDAAITYAIEALGEFFGTDRIAVFEIHPEKNIINNTYEWCEKGIETEKSNLQGVNLDQFLNWKNKLHDQQHVILGAFNQFDNSHKALNAIIKIHESQYAAVFPMVSGNELNGFASFIFQKLKGQLNEKYAASLRFATNVIFGSISRLRYEKLLISARQQAEASNLAKSEFLVNMAHEIKTRLHEILGFSQIVLHATNDPKHKQALDIVDKSGNALVELINDMLEFSKIEVAAKITPTKTNIPELLHNLKDFFLPVIEKKNIRFGIMTPPDLPLLKLDQLRLRQVLIKLIDNSLKYTNSGSISILVKSEKSEVSSTKYNLKISVKDTGIGITKSKKETINKFFEKSDSIFFRDENSSGLGLQLAKTLIGIMKGKIEMESDIGKGSIFTISFFDVEADLGEDQRLSGDSDHKNIKFKGQKILVVDDVISHFLLIQSILEEYNLNCIYAENGNEGVKKANEDKPDLILMDINMPPGMNGYETTQMIRGNPVTASFPVIAFTTNTQDALMEKNRHLFDELLAKVPLRLPQLIATLSKFLKHDNLEDTSVNDADISADDMDDMDFLQDIVASFNDRVTNLVEVIDFTEIDKLITDLQSFNSEKKSGRLERYTEELKEAYDAFDFDKLSLLLKQFEKTLIH